jgi:hypothetical protein
MNDLELTNVLMVAVFGLAIAQVLTILLTNRRERDVRDLRELIEQQRLQLIELGAWIAGRAASQTRQIASRGEARAEQIAYAKTGKPTQEDDQPRGAEDAALRAAKELEWQRDIASRLQAGLQAAQTPQAEARINKSGSSASDVSFRWSEVKPSEPRELVESREAVANFGKERDEQDPGSRGISQQLRITHDQLERVTEAVNWLNEDVAKASALTRPNGKPPAE